MYFLLNITNNVLNLMLIGLYTGYAIRSALDRLGKGYTAHDLDRALSPAILPLIHQRIKKYLAGMFAIDLFLGGYMAWRLAELLSRMGASGVSLWTFVVAWVLFCITSRFVSTYCRAVCHTWKRYYRND